MGRDLSEKWERTLTKLRKKETIRLGITLPAMRDIEKKLGKEFLSALSKMYERENIHAHFILQTKEDGKHATEKMGAHESHIHTFWNVEEWAGFTKDLDIVISTRIHGSMATFMAGTPAVVIPTDFRIMELVNSMKLPNLSMDKFLEANSEDLLSILELVKPDFEEFERNRREKIAIYLEMLTAYGIEMHPELLAVHENAKIGNNMDEA